MIIYTVQEGDTVESIANQYNIPKSRLDKDNDFSPDYTLNIGQAIMITEPSKTYITKEGDTLSSIAESNGISLLELLRNNPQLSNLNNPNAREELVINYERTNDINVMGYTTVYVTKEVLKRTLPYLTYLIILNYRVDASGIIMEVEDNEIINLAYQYGVGPVMFLSSMNESGRGSYGTMHAILNNLEVQNTIIEKTLSIMKIKGFVGLDLAFYSILREDLVLYVDFVTNITERLNQDGFEVFVTLTPKTMGYQEGIKYEMSYYADLGRAANNVILISYLWQQGVIPQVAQTTAKFLKELLDYVVTQIPPEKIYIGLTRIAYDWELPYVEGETLGSSLTNSGALNLANQLGSVIEFDDDTQTPYFYYNDAGVFHYVWYKDARSINAIIKLVEEYGLAGVAVWNILYYHSPTWLSLNTMYKIEQYFKEYVLVPMG